MQKIINTTFYSNKLLGICFLLLLGCSSSRTLTDQHNNLYAISLKPVGRFAINNNRLELMSAAAHFAFDFEGNECRVHTSLINTGAHNYIQYELDGVYQKRLKIDGNNVPVVINTPTSGRHRVTIYKTTEALTGPVFIDKITGYKLKAFEETNAPAIEFIGNSITCGAAADASVMPCGTGEYLDQHNAYFAYGPRVARALQTKFMLSSVSGIGIYRNWNSDGPTMPAVYEKPGFNDTNPAQWNFKNFNPSIVSIALGTNDFSMGDGKKRRLPFDSSLFVNNYIQFVQKVKAHYPGAQVALLSSPMMNGANREMLQHCLNAVKLNIDRLYPADKRVAVHFFKPMQAHGCGGHPSVEDHAVLAEELVPFFKSLL